MSKVGPRNEELRPADHNKSIMRASKCQWGGWVVEMWSDRLLGWIQLCVCVFTTWRPRLLALTRPSGEKPIVVKCASYCRRLANATVSAAPEDRECINMAAPRQHMMLGCKSRSESFCVISKPRPDTLVLVRSHSCSAVGRQWWTAEGGRAACRRDSTRGTLHRGLEYRRWRHLFRPG